MKSTADEAEEGGRRDGGQALIELLSGTEVLHDSGKHNNLFTK